MDDASDGHGQLWNAYYHLGDTCSLLGEHDDALSYLSAAVAQAELDGHETATARSRL